MKRPAIFCAGLLLAAFPLLADTASSTAALMAAYQSGFYPGVVRYADEILARSPGSPAAARAAIYKGECLYRMGRVSEAESSLAAATVDGALQAARSYWLGRISSDRQDWQAALSHFLRSASAAKDIDAVYYAYSLYYAGNAYLATAVYEKALPLYAYVVANGSQYAVPDYEQAALALLQCHIQLGQYAQATSLSDALSGAPFSAEGSTLVLLYKADALVGLNDYSGAYALYCTVLSETEVSSLAATAMQKAYVVSSSHRKEVGKEPGDVLVQAQGRLAAYPDLLGEFWLRLAVDAYSAGDFGKAAAYFDEAENASSVAADENSASVIQTAALYRAEMAVSADSDAASGARTALAALAIGGKEPAPGTPLYGAFAAARSRFYGLSGDWAACEEQADLAVASDTPAVMATAVYWKALSLYQREAYGAACAFIEQQEIVLHGLSADLALQTLYARALAQNGRLHDADVLFYALGEQGALDNDGTLDYAKSLMNGGYMISASAQAGKATGAEAAYLSGLAAFNRKQWKAAASFFRTSLDGLDARYTPYARFYCGYALYRAGAYSDAYAVLSAFIESDAADTAGNPQLRFLALTTAVRASVQTGAYERVFPLAERAVQTAGSEKQKEESILLCAGVYADAGQYDKALAVLAPYGTSRTDFGWQCRYQTAQIQIQKKDYAAADKTFAALAADRSAGSYGEEAAYRRGELAYSVERYGDAVGFFDAYCKKWANGRFYDGARFFAAASLVKSGETDRAILYYKQVDEYKPSATYRYSAEKNLMELYKNRREYQVAISYAQKLLDGYGEQAQSDGIAQAIEELKLLELGYDEPTAAKEREYDQLGKTRTAAGRKAGTELAALWGGSAIYRQRAASLAQALLAVQKEHLPDEAADAAKNASLVAQYLREQTENARAAELYLSAAEYARLSGDDTAAAQSLYGATEAFDAARRYGDAKAAARTLSSLYPDSRFVQAAQKIVESGE